MDGKPGAASRGVTSAWLPVLEPFARRQGSNTELGRRQGHLGRAARLTSGPGVKQNSQGLAYETFNVDS